MTAVRLGPTFDPLRPDLETYIAASTMPSLSAHLLETEAASFRDATTHPFLTSLASAKLPLQDLISWFSQDRQYQAAYVNFVGAMISQVQVLDNVERKDSVDWQALILLIRSLTNIEREIVFFEDCAKAEGWREIICQAPPLVHTRVYQDLFAGATARGRPLLVGLVTLWATEECYLRAWQYVQSMSPGQPTQAYSSLLSVLIPNWTSPEFESFVVSLRELVDRWADRIEQNGPVWRECEDAFRQVMFAEKNFWPCVVDSEP